MVEHRPAAARPAGLARLRFPSHWDSTANRVASTGSDLASGPGPAYLPALPAPVSSGWLDGVGSVGSRRSHTAADRGALAAYEAAPGAPGDIVVHQSGSWGGCPWEGTCYIVRLVRWGRHARNAILSW